MKLESSEFPMTVDLRRVPATPPMSEPAARRHGRPAGASADRWLYQAPDPVIGTRRGIWPARFARTGDA